MCTKDLLTDHTTSRLNRADSSSTMCSADILPSVSVWTASRIPTSLVSVSKNALTTNSLFPIPSLWRSLAHWLPNSKSQLWSPKAKLRPWLDFLSMKHSSSRNTKSRTKNSSSWSTFPWIRRSKRRSRRKLSKSPKRNKQRKNENEEVKIYMLYMLFNLLTFWIWISLTIVKYLSLQCINIWS